MPDTRRPLKGIGVGAGYFSQFHYEAWSRMPEVELAAIVELDQFKAEGVARKFNIGHTYTSLTQALEVQRPDFVDIITRPESHLEIVQQVAAQGIDIICQKPLAPTPKEAERIVGIAQAAGVRLMVHENFRFQPWHREMKKLILQGVIGDCLHSLSCRTRMGDGWQADAYQARQPYFVHMPQFLIYETGIHFIDTYRFLAGEVRSVFASLRKFNPQIAGEDAGIVFFEFESGARGLWDASRYHEPNCDDPRYTFGEFLIEGNGGALRLYADGRLTLQPLGLPEHDIIYSHRHHNFASDCVYHTQRHFVDRLLSGAEFETSGTEILKSLRVQAAVYQSAESGQVVVL
jgi:predicted dehydrogenase